MAKDPAFLFYPGDASEDTQFMNRLERGCYFDILKAQKKFRRFTFTQLQKVLGQDFDSCWPAIELVLSRDGEFYFIGWVDEKIKEREAFSESRRNNRRKKTQDKHMNNICKTCDEDMVIEDEDGNGIELENKKESPENSVPRETPTEHLETKLQVFADIFGDEMFIEQLAMTHRGKDIKQAFEECYTHHSNAPNPPLELWEWKQKLNTWLSNTKSNGSRTTTGKKQQHTTKLAASVAKTYRNVFTGRRDGPSGGPPAEHD